MDEEFLSTPSARRATYRGPDAGGPQAISIHALREEGDAHASPEMQELMEISIHALREEGDQSDNEWEVDSIVFLSTPSARRATQSRFRQCRRSGISIHALREEGDD